MKKEVFFWGMYDLANTIFSALFVTFFFPLYTKQYLGGNELQLGLVFGLSMLAVGLIVPVIGAWSDRLGKRIPFIIFFTTAACIFSWLVIKSSLEMALLFGFLANFSYHGALTTYDALLPKIAGKQELGKVSGIGVAMGYVGTIISLLIAGLLFYTYGWETRTAVESVFTAASLLFFVFALPILLIKEERARKAKFFQPVKDVFNTIRNFQKKTLFFLTAMFFFTNAIFAVIIFLFPFAQQLNIGIKTFFVIYALQAVSAAIGSLIAGKLVDKHGPKKVLKTAAIAWIIVILMLLFFPSTTTFLILGLVGGAALGTVWTAERPQLLKMIKPNQVGQFNGYLDLAGKFSGILAMVFGILVHFWNYQAALTMLIGSFLIGLWFLEKI